MTRGTVFKGLWVALATPFRGGAVDEAALRKLVRHVLDGGADGLVPEGSTGEAATQSEAERQRVLEVVLEECNGKVPVMPGTGTNCTETTIAATRAAREAGAQAALVVTPYYNKPTPEGQVAHFEAVAKAVEFPILMYNIPGRTATNMTVETMLQLGRLPEIVGVKEASGSLDTATELVAGAAERGLDFAVMSGDDSLTLPILAVGGTGVVSVIGNVLPREMSDLIRYFKAGHATDAIEIHARLFPLIKALFAETNPAPLKELLSLIGIGTPEVRLPLVTLRPTTSSRLRDAWAKWNHAASPAGRTSA